MNLYVSKFKRTVSSSSNYFNCYKWFDLRDENKILTILNMY